MVNFFSVIAKSQTYLNMLYLLLSYPLGIIYFVFLVTGISLGFGLVITLAGIPLLVLMTFLWYWVGIFEARMTFSILGISAKPEKSSGPKQKTFLQKISKHLSSPITWKSLAYLLIKFPLGIVSFVFLVTLLSVSVSLILFPLAYYLIPNVDLAVINGAQVITHVWQVIAISIIGIIFLFISLHILNGLAYVSGLLAKVLLGESNSQKTRKTSRKNRKKR